MFTIHTMASRAHRVAYQASLTSSGIQKVCGVFLQIDLTNKSVYIGKSRGDLLMDSLSLRGNHKIPSKDVSAVISVSLEGADIISLESVCAQLLARVARHSGFKVKNCNVRKIAGVHKEGLPLAQQAVELVWSVFCGFAAKHSWDVQELPPCSPCNCSERKNKAKATSEQAKSSPTVVALVRQFVEKSRKAKNFNPLKLQKQLQEEGFSFSLKAIYDLIIDCDK